MRTANGAAQESNLRPWGYHGLAVLKFGHIWLWDSDSAG
jgi:hypothetical protein